MPASKFDEKLPARAGRPETDYRPGPCAMGPIDPGVTIDWMRVWILQKDGDKVAVATGTSSRHVDGDDERPPYQRRWKIRTELERRSDPFTGHRATAVAMAMITRPDGSRDVEHWSQPVAIVR
jgi:hypothetical protein